MLAPTILCAQEKGFGFSLYHNSRFVSELFTTNNFTIERIQNRNPSVFAGLHYTSIGKNKPLSLKHGIDVLIPYGKQTSGFAPRNTYTFITNALSYSFLNNKALNASLRTDLKFLLGKEKFEREIMYSSANRWILGGGFSVQPLPEKNPVKLVYQASLTPAYFWRPPGNEWAYHFSNLGLEYNF